MHLPPCDRIKPFRNGQATLYRNGKRFAVSLDGQVLDI
jgi:hypothetical protein